MPVDSWRPEPEQKKSAPTACNILCDGPSMAHFDAERDIIKGAVVSVNTAQAIYRSEVWCIHSPLAQLTSRLADYGMTPAMCLPEELWHPAMWDWPNTETQFELAKNVARKTHWPRAPVPMASMLGWVSRVEWSQVAPLAAAAVAISRGVKRIRIIGADMRGTGYGGIDAGVWKWNENESNAQARKWKRERVAMQYAIAEAKERGIEIEVLLPSARAVESVTSRPKVPA